MKKTLIALAIAVTAGAGVSAAVLMQDGAGTPVPSPSPSPTVVDRTATRACTEEAINEVVLEYVTAAIAGGITPSESVRVDVTYNQMDGTVTIDCGDGTQVVAQVG